MQKATDARMDKRSVLKAIFYFLLARLGVRRLRGHSFFAMLLAKPAVAVDFGAHRGEFFAALKAEYPVSRALLVEADPALAESLKGTFGNKADVLHAALVGPASVVWHSEHGSWSAPQNSRATQLTLKHSLFFQWASLTMGPDRIQRCWSIAKIVCGGARRGHKLWLRVYPNALREWTKMHRQFSSMKAHATNWRRSRM